MMASGSSARGNGRQGYRAGGQRRNFCFFFTRQFQRENEEQDREKRDRASKPVFRLCWLASSFSLLQRQLLLAAAATSTLRQQQHINTLR